MGICFGKDEPEPKPAPARKRVETAPNTPAPQRRRDRNERSQPQAVGGWRGDETGAGGASGGGEGSGPGSFVAGSSYTDRRMEEFDEIRNIVEKTTHRFIDVGTKATVLDAKDLEERHRAYGAAGVNEPLDTRGMAAFALPRSVWPSASAADVGQAMARDAAAAVSAVPDARTDADALADAADAVALPDMFPLAGLVVPIAAL